MAKKVNNKRKRSFKQRIGYNKNKELFWILAFMVFVIAVLLISEAIFSGENHFTYKGLSFTKVLYGEIDMYHYYYYFENNGKQYQYNLYLRLDPRTNNVPIDAYTVYYPNQTVYFAYNSTGLLDCSNLTRDAAQLASFFTNNFQPIVVGITNAQAANASNLTYVDCNVYPNNPVIKIESANETRIYQEKNCYVIDIANCNSLAPIEKFEVQAILDAKSRNVTA